jgi:hypothetical protein
MLYGTSTAMTLLEVSHATVYRMVGREFELVRLSVRSSLATSEGAAKVVAGREKSTDMK